MGEWLADFGGDILVRRPGVARSSTVKAWLVGASRPWPTAMRSPEVRAFLRGLEVLNPALPEAAGVELPRRVDMVKLRHWMCAKVSWCGGYPVALALGLVAGLRLREAARILVQRGAAGFVLAGSIVRWEEAAQTKANLRGTRRIAVRVARVPEECLSPMRRLPLPWRAPERRIEVVVRETARSLFTAGVADDVRAHRRTVATTVRTAAVRAGASEAEAVRWAQRALSHQERGEAIFRYLPTLLSDTGQRFLEEAQLSGS